MGGKFVDGDDEILEEVVLGIRQMGMVLEAGVRRSVMFCC